MTEYTRLIEGLLTQARATRQRRVLVVKPGSILIRLGNGQRGGFAV